LNPSVRFVRSCRSEQRQSDQPRKPGPELAVGQAPGWRQARARLRQWSQSQSRRPRGRLPHWRGDWSMLVQLPKLVWSFPKIFPLPAGMVLSERASRPWGKGQIRSEFHPKRTSGPSATTGLASRSSAFPRRFRTRSAITLANAQDSHARVTIFFAQRLVLPAQVNCMAARTSCMVCSARRRARLEPASRISLTRDSEKLARRVWTGSNT